MFIYLQELRSLFNGSKSIIYTRNGSELFVITTHIICKSRVGPEEW